MKNYKKVSKKYKKKYKKLKLKYENRKIENILLKVHLRRRLRIVRYLLYYMIRNTKILKMKKLVKLVLVKYINN